MNIDVHIEELVLDGFPDSYRGEIAAIVQRELTRMFAEAGVPPALTRDEQITNRSGGSFELGQVGSVEHTGAQIARAIYGGIGQ